MKRIFSKLHNIKLSSFQERFPHHQRLLIKDLLADGIMDIRGSGTGDRQRECSFPG